MKVLLLLALVSMPAVAQASLPASLECSVGVGGEDNFQSVSINGSEVEFTMHETHISVKKSKARISGNSIAIIDRNITGSAEGDTFTAKLDSLLVYNEVDKVLSVTLLLDGHAQIPTTNLSCEN